MYTSNKINSSYHLVIIAVSPFKGKRSTDEIVLLTSPESSLPPHMIPLLSIYYISTVELMFTMADHWEVNTRGVSLVYSKLQLFVLMTKVKYLSFCCFLIFF